MKDLIIVIFHNFSHLSIFIYIPMGNGILASTIQKNILYIIHYSPRIATQSNCDLNSFGEVFIPIISSDTLRNNE